MTNNTSPQVTATVLPWNTDHLICKCGHKWTDHDGLGCTKQRCDCTQ